MPACTPERGNSTPTLRPDACDLAILKGASVATMPAPRPLATLRRVTPRTLACLLRLMRFLLRGASVCLGLLKYTSFARRASCPAGRRAAAGQPHAAGRDRPGTSIAVCQKLAARQCWCRGAGGFSRQPCSAPPGADQR